MGNISRRDTLKGIGLLGGGSLLGGRSLTREGKEGKEKSKNGVFSYCFNTSTIRGQKVDFEREFEIVAEAGYDGIEIWIPSLSGYVNSGKSLSDLNKKIKDLGLKVEDAIGFAAWVSDDETARNNAIEQVKREMDMLAQIGCKRLAAPPMGATEKAGLDLDKAGQRFRKLVEVGMSQGVIPQLELWGFSKNLFKLGHVLHVAGECGLPETRILADIYHLYKGGSNFDGLKLIAPEAIEIFHINDYSVEVSPDVITDADRIHAGDGDAPMTQVLKDLAHNRSNVVLSLELFNPNYYKQDALVVAKEGLSKMKAAVAEAGLN